MNIEEIINNLNTLSKIQIGNKLTIKNNKLIIDNSYISCITRRFNNINRYIILDFILKIIINLFKFFDTLLLNIKSNNEDLIKLNNILKKTINGLLNLSLTYHNDKTIQIEIDIIIDIIIIKINYNKSNNFRKNKYYIKE